MKNDERNMSQNELETKEEVRKLAEIGSGREPWQPVLEIGVRGDELHLKFVKGGDPNVRCEQGRRHENADNDDAGDE